jgi:hypothetical protein
MMKHHLWATLLSLSLSVSLIAPAQSYNSDKKEVSAARPYKILTYGKRITIQSKQNIKTVFVWTTSGHRIIEQKEINSASYTFNITVPEKVFFMRIDMEDGNKFTQKLGVQ